MHGLRLEGCTCILVNRGRIGRPSMDTKRQLLQGSSNFALLYFYASARQYTKRRVYRRYMQF